MRYSLTLFVILLLTINNTLFTQDWITEHVQQGKPDTSLAVSQLEFIKGHWRGTGLGGTVEEFWTDSSGDHMIGLFKFINQDKLSFSELESISKHEDGIIFLKVKHFNPDFIGWEEKDKYVQFSMVTVNETGAYFNGASFIKSGENEMDVYVLMRSRDGTYSESKFAYQRVR